MRITLGCLLVFCCAFQSLGQDTEKISSSATTLAAFHRDAVIAKNEAERSGNRLASESAWKTHQEKAKAVSGNKVVWETKISSVTADGMIRLQMDWEAPPRVTKTRRNTDPHVTVHAIAGELVPMNIDVAKLTNKTPVVIRGKISEVRVEDRRLVVVFDELSVSLK